jgi:hypothetical protein
VMTSHTSSGAARISTRRTILMPEEVLQNALEAQRIMQQS